MTRFGLIAILPQGRGCALHVASPQRPYHPGCFREPTPGNTFLRYLFFDGNFDVGSSQAFA